MKRFFRRVQSHISFTVLRGIYAAFRKALVPVSCTPVELPKPTPVVKELNYTYDIDQLHYQPADDEPSIFSDNPSKINHRWASWWLKRNPSKGHLALYDEVNRIKHMLVTEHPRQVDKNSIPDLLVGKPLTISLKWVIWYKYTFDCSYIEAHQHGLAYHGLDE